MKNNIKILTVLSLILVVGISFLFGEALDSSRYLYNGSYHSAGNMRLRVSNYGMLGGGGAGNYPSLEYPNGSGINYLYQGSLWIGGKKHRRNANGQILYWLAQYPMSQPADSAQVITQDDPLWNPTKKMVIDTLTTVGFDGDMDLYEFLPAYNPLMSTNTVVSELYPIYNIQDNLLLSLAGNPSPRQFQIPDPLGTYCFSIPSDIPDNNPGYETLTGYYYDYCPFGTIGDRDWGTSRAYSKHVPLGLAIEQQSYAWPLADYGNEIIIKYTIKNTSQIDTLFDISIGTLMDNDCGPTSWSAGLVASDDVSGYCPGTGYEFAYSRDADGDGGLTTGIVGAKIRIPDRNLNYAAWYWHVGDGPDDSDEIQLYPDYLPHRTANEKYWLMTGKNPSSLRYINLRQSNVSDYELPSPADARYMLSYFGAQPGTQEYNDPQNRLFIAPNSEIVLYLAVMVGTDLTNLKQTAQVVENLIDNNIAIEVDPNAVSLPLLQNVHQTSINTITLNWFSYTNPDHFEMMYKQAEAPASSWQSIEMSGTSRTGQIGNLTDGAEYKFKVASIFYPGGNEVYLETSPMWLTIDNANSTGDPTTPVIAPNLNVYPNPFRTEVNIRVQGLDKSVKTIDIFDIKGQKIRTFTSPGISNNLTWDGRNSNGDKVGSGVYFIRVRIEQKEIVRKVLFLK